MNTIAAEPCTQEPVSSLKDPSGRLFRVDQRIIRSVARAAVPAVTAFLESSAARTLLYEGMLVSTRILAETEIAELLPKLDSVAEIHCADGGLLLEHERIPFVSFPYEWCPEMLWTAADLTLKIAEQLRPEGFAMKDAVTYNVVFRGPDPVFVDLLSFEMRSPQSPSVLPEGEFARSFVLPLLMNKYYGMPLDRLLLTRPLLDPKEIYGWCKGTRKLRSPFLQLVSIPAWYGARKNSNRLSAGITRVTRTPSRKEVLARWLIGDLRHKLDDLVPAPKASNHTQHYSPAEIMPRCRFLRRTFEEFSPKRVLSLGCNPDCVIPLTAPGRNVVAIDREPASVGQLWRIARAERLDLLPLLVDICRPTPSMGWRNQERPGFLQRVRGAFDAVVMLGVVHHLLMHERIPLEEVVELAAEITSDLLIIEDIDRDEPVFQAMSAGREHLFTALTPETLRNQFLRKFYLSRSEELPGTKRQLYVFRKK